MKLGTFMMPVHPIGKNYVQSLREDREATLLADALGFSEAYVGEHTTDLCETIPSCLTFLASLAYETRQIKLGKVCKTPVTTRGGVAFGAGMS